MFRPELPVTMFQVWCWGKYGCRCDKEGVGVDSNVACVKSLLLKLLASLSS